MIDCQEKKAASEFGQLNPPHPGQKKHSKISLQNQLRLNFFVFFFSSS